jgi:adenine-specific DNA-methyltransferase
MTVESSADLESHDYLSKQLIPTWATSAGPALAPPGVPKGVGKRGRGINLGMVFLDPFSGSGAVSRLARFMGFTVHANDWEPYAHIVTSAYLTVSKAEGESLYGGFGGGKQAFAFFNALTPKPGYIARTYAPRSTETADYRTERLFYTAENGAFIDTVRDAVEERWPGWDLPETDLREKILLVSALLYEAATHVNTSGVFKACHKGFGGHGHDALKRILSPMSLEFPVLYDGPGCTAEQLDALDFLSRRSGDICYLDPPYTIHQYGSNYHLLNSIVLWDKPEMSNRLDSSGRLEDKAGIRGDWKRTKSRFCSRRTAAAALAEILDRADARSNVLSNKTDGLIGMDELREMLTSQGKVEFFADGYPAYAGEDRAEAGGSIPWRSSSWSPALPVWEGEYPSALLSRLPSGSQPRAERE